MKKIYLTLIIGIFLLVTIPAGIYIIDAQSVEKVNFLTTDLFCEKLNIEKYTEGKGKKLILSPCYKVLDVSDLNIDRVTMNVSGEEVRVYRID